MNNPFPGAGRRGLHHAERHLKNRSRKYFWKDFKRHPAVAPLIAGGKLVEYAAHVVQRRRNEYAA